MRSQSSRQPDKPPRGLSGIRLLDAALVSGATIAAGGLAYVLQATHHPTATHALIAGLSGAALGTGVLILRLARIRLDRDPARLAADRVERVRADVDQFLPSLQAVHSLNALIQPELPFPLLRRWTVNAELALCLSTLIVRVRPKLIVELGSGASSVIAAETIRRFELDTRLVSIEHDEGWARRTLSELAVRGLPTDGIRVAPLVATPGVPGSHWYDSSRLTDLDEIDMLFVDGPPGSGAPMARFPAGPILLPRMRPGGHVIVDDVGRSDERAMVNRWTEEFALEDAELFATSDRFVVLLTPSDHNGSAR